MLLIIVAAPLFGFSKGFQESYFQVFIAAEQYSPAGDLLVAFLYVGAKGEIDSRNASMLRTSRVQIRGCNEKLRKSISRVQIVFFVYILHC